MKRKSSKTHKGVEFAVDDASGEERVFKTFDEAAGFAVSLAAGGRPKVAIDVLVYNVSGARWWGGDYAAQEYRADPDASVHERLVIRADSQGRVA